MITKVRIEAEGESPAAVLEELAWATERLSPREGGDHLPIASDQWDLVDEHIERVKTNAPGYAAYYKGRRVLAFIGKLGWAPDPERLRYTVTPPYASTTTGQTYNLSVPTDATNG